jgi:alpha-glucosidase
MAEGKDESAFAWPPKIHPKLDTLPVYVRGGSIIPMQPVVQSTDETPVGPLELRVYPGEQCNGSIYLDDGRSFRYQQGEFLRQEFACQYDNNSLRVHFNPRQGKYLPWWKTLEVAIYNWPSGRAEAKLSTSASPLKTTYDAPSHALHVIVPDVAGEAELTIGGSALHF